MTTMTEVTTTPPERELVALRDKTLKFKKARKADPERCERLREMVGGDECKLQFILWAEGTSLDIGGIHHGEPVFRPAICAWEAWKAAFTRAATLPQGVWLPIESAPKDGTMVLLWGDDQAVVGEWLKCGSPYWLTGLAGDIESTYTHWQPLPTPPPAELGKGDVK